jgi:hypothetical protein
LTIKAGEIDDDYSFRVKKFNWVQLHKKSRWLIRSFANYLSKRYDYVLIDSQTGIADISGIATALMPDKLVVVFTPNQDSLRGALDLAKKATKYRKDSSDARSLLAFPLPSRVEASEPHLQRKWRYGDRKQNMLGYQCEFENLFKEIYELDKCDLQAYFDNVQIQNVPRYAYSEEIAALTELNDRFSLIGSYEIFVSKIMNLSTPWD